MAFRRMGQNGEKGLLTVVPGGAGGGGVEVVHVAGGHRHGAHRVPHRPIVVGIIPSVKAVPCNPPEQKNRDFESLAEPL